jgi:hypothetical protein
MTSAADREFLGTLENWFRARTEILVLVRYSRAAGSKDFEFFSSFETLVTRLDQLPPSTSIIVFREPQLPLRGIVDDEFVSGCLKSRPNGSEFLLLESRHRNDGKPARPRWAAGETHAELREVLEEARGRAVAVEFYPPWLSDSSKVISAVVPDRDGVVRVGVY